jgi:hypothetical protein
MNILENKQLKYEMMRDFTRIINHDLFEKNDGNQHADIISIILLFSF